MIAKTLSKLTPVLSVAALLGAGCQGQVSGTAGDEPGLRTAAYSVAPWAANPVENLYSLVDDGPVRICIEMAPGATIARSTVENDLAWATWEWVNAVQPNSTASLHADVVFTCDRLVADYVPLFDMTVIVYPGPGRAWAHGDVMDLYDGEPQLYETVLHEMGHFFGLGDTYIEGGGCQPNQPPSVMCNATFNTLQPDDVSGARQAFRVINPSLYFGPVPIAAEGSGRCIDASAFGTADGTYIQLWDCWPGPLSNQVWDYNWETKLLVGEHSGKCLDVAWSGTENGSAVWLWGCHGGPNQQWEYWTDGTIRSVASGKCLEVAGFGTENGSAIQIWDCHGGSNQIWHGH